MSITFIYSIRGLKVLSSDMDPAEIRFIQGRSGFLKKNPPVPHPERTLYRFHADDRRSQRKEIDTEGYVKPPQ